MLRTILKLAFFVVGALAAPPQSSTESTRVALLHDFQDFVDALPMQRMYDLVVRHLNEDVEMQAALKHVQGKEFQHAIRALMARPSVKEIKVRYTEAGLDVERYEQIIGEVISSLEIDVADDTDRSFGKFLEALDELIPYEKLLGILADKLERSAVFIDFFKAITTEHMHMLFEKTMHSSDFKHVARELEDMDVSVYNTADVLFNLFGWKKDQPNVNDL